MNILINEIELKEINTYEVATNDLSHARNLAYMLGGSSNNVNLFDQELSKLVRVGVLEKVYDFMDGDFREGLYNFVERNAQVSFHGVDHMGLSLFYNY